MKKLILILTTCVFLRLCAPAFATTTTLAVADAYPVDKTNETVTYEYVITSVAASTTARFKIPVPDIAGRLVQVSWNSASLDCDVWGATKDNQDQGSVYEVFRIIECSGGYSPEIPAPGRYFRNRDTTEAAYMYVAVQNDDDVNATGAAGRLILTFSRR